MVGMMSRRPDKVFICYLDRQFALASRNFSGVPRRWHREPQALTLLTL